MVFFDAALISDIYCSVDEMAASSMTGSLV